MTPLSRRSTRIVWGWCVAYTVLATQPARERRRGEIRSHLWESEHAALPAVAVSLSAIRGVAADIGWAMSSGIPRVLRSFGTPTPYVVLAPLFPVQAWIVSAVTVGAAARIAEGAGAIGGAAMLACAGAAWLWQRRAR
jgi:hypothetical protein